ncbi:hypothetical protein HQ945_08875 [Phyllobacterium sp. BT25]|uniref:Uncharacterized protein n=1 Tax=Phyllobacterium pellucidum TaxID=2740464 RepID=A0A849VMJ5_9HYPH|nr:hypothetical protein [Phyllobacterium pellucidum]NTS31365.1 hypothetical protein [Phyllobacterium pellucidum]
MVLNSSKHGVKGPDQSPSKDFDANGESNSDPEAKRVSDVFTTKDA